jgi:hypothetical protein
MNKNVSLLISMTVALAVAVWPANATTYPGTGNANGSGSDGTAISSVAVNNDANNISFTIDANPANGAIDAYTFYAVQIQIIGQAQNGYTTLANPIWLNTSGPAIGISSGENAVLNFTENGYYSNGGDVNGATPFIYSSGSWTEGSLSSYTAGGQGNWSVTATVPLSSLGLSAGASFYFDVVSSYTSWGTSGPQSAYGALDSVSGYPAETDNSWKPWTGVNAYDSATDASGTTFGTAASEYTVIPEPAAIGALSGLGGLLMIVRQRKFFTR